MKPFVELTDINGKKIFVNALFVTAVGPAGPDSRVGGDDPSYVTVVANPTAWVVPRPAEEIVAELVAALE